MIKKVGFNLVTLMFILTIVLLLAISGQAPIGTGVKYYISHWSGIRGVIESMLKDILNNDANWMQNIVDNFDKVLSD